MKGKHHTSISAVLFFNRRNYFFFCFSVSQNDSNELIVLLHNRGGHKTGEGDIYPPTSFQRYLQGVWAPSHVKATLNWEG